MKKTKWTKLLSALLFLTVMLVGCGNTPDDSSDSTSEGSSAAVESPVTDFEYEENEDSGITITKYIGEDIEVMIPGKIEGKDVTKIGKGAFEYQRNIVSIKLPDTVTVIEDDAFRSCIDLTAINFPQAMQVIGPRAFYECVQLAEVSLPNALTKIGSSSFQECKSIKEIRIPNSITEWGGGAFSNSGIEKIIFDEGIESIGESTFAATNIREVVLPGSIKTIPALAFAGCKNLESVTLSDGILTIENNVFGSRTIYGENAKLIEIVIPASVKNITEATFIGCKALEKVKFEGNAPENFALSPEEYEDINGNTFTSEIQGDYTVYYHEGAQGFTLPTWNDYTTETW